ncbi:outer membrane beta-barrel protein [Helicobacter bilis]|uniref:Outer membrane beta-barrel protein n=1 Tax=Helicobacter bilis TaxID=37372 RepID=A0A4U8U4C4_9HELI|nr:outer membrane beta-barrel protein [Helicobacter bilis]MCI7410923.1 outer membrane protein [Helicobacter bilis]MDD7295794.1 outer membrane beta-barrel protein [Helicobacter bilis]MDY4399133.1 outer membrane beta-barrel protein [Helicobacter bilis]TLE07299.1 outer membrane beta-barrel protein [Helicobacter bilis]TLE08350.1 outer membrane beta-barrel protein [Helicobacter bilis]
MKKHLLSVVVASCICVNMSFADSKGNGFFLGVDFGGSVGALTNTGLTISGNAGQGGVPAKETMQVNAGFGLNLRIGGQRYFDRENGMRYYLSIGGVFGAPSYAFGDLKVSGITMIGDINMDFLHDFTSTESQRVGIYVGMGAGYMTTLYPGGSALTIQNMNIPSFSGVTIGLNFGVRTLVARHHQFEFSTKSVVTHSKATENIIGFQVFLGANYSYLF